MLTQRLGAIPLADLPLVAEEDRVGEVVTHDVIDQHDIGPGVERHLIRLLIDHILLNVLRDHDHVLSKRMVQHASFGCTMVMENLTHIRSRATMKNHPETQRRLHSWSFAQFQRFLTYKA